MKNKCFINRLFALMAILMAADVLLAQKETADWVSNPLWGFKFKVPKGWVSQADQSCAIMGHDKIAGMIIVLPHQARNLQELKEQMQMGVQEESFQLSPSGNLISRDKATIAGDYTGYYDLQAVRAICVGVLCQNGGGACVIALSSPDKFGRELSNTLDLVVKSVQSSRPSSRSETSGLMSNFSGTWWSATKNTETKITFMPNGEFYENYEASYSGDSKDQYGNETLGWGGAGEQKTGGRWSVHGTREGGTITIVYQNGTEREVRYQVHVENGEVYWSEYYFNGELYGKQR